MRCILQCVTTRSEAEVTRGVILDDAAVVAQLRSMEPMQQFPQEKVERCVQAASALSRPLLEKLGNAVPLQAQQIVIPMLAVGLCFELDPETLQLVSDFVLSTITVKGQLSGILKDRAVSLSGNLHYPAGILRPRRPRHGALHPAGRAISKRPLRRHRAAALVRFTA